MAGKSSGSEGATGLGPDTREVKKKVKEATGDVMSGMSLEATVGTADRKQV